MRAGTRSPRQSPRFYGRPTTSREPRGKGSSTSQRCGAHVCKSFTAQSIYRFSEQGRLGAERPAGGGYDGFIMLELEGKLVRLENGAWARYRAVPVTGVSGLHVIVAVELSPDERARL